MNKIKCPHCDYEYTDDDMDMIRLSSVPICSNKEKLHTYCMDCTEQFVVQIEYTLSYETFKP
ncbi:hypothetical protein KAR91_46985 [Candidatus Pacearchaeota archaeon]|nr:hypothetical protein [Candidatus Pacearchaeota archaeon]